MSAQEAGPLPLDPHGQVLQTSLEQLTSAFAAVTAALAAEMVRPRLLVALHRAGKRALDVIAAALLLVLLSPLILLVAILVRLSSPGPVIFAQERMRGRRVREGRKWVWRLEPFTLYKFRTMQADADPSLHREYMAAYLVGDEERLNSLRPGRRPGDSYRPARDPRITRVGGALRTLSLDELPQLWNVLRGDMSLVGPRPPMAYEVELYEPEQLRRLACPPGITGWAQVRGRCSVDFEEMARLDVEYIQRQSVWFDLLILLLTIPVVLSRKGAG